MEEKIISKEESLLIIQQMIQTAKIEQKDDGKGWIIWGWMLFFASVLTIFNLRFHWFGNYFFWNVFGLLVAVICIYEIIRDRVLKRTVKVRTYTNDLFSKLNIGFFISLMFIIVGMNIPVYIPERVEPLGAISPMFGFPLLISLYAFWILIYGTALNFKPSVIGAYVTWVIGIVALFVKTFELVMVMHALAALCGYIIPGYIANKEFKKIHSKDKDLKGV